MAVHNLSERKDLEKFLLLAEKKFSTAFYLSPAPMVISDPETGKIVDVNKAFEAGSGYTGSELIGHNGSDFSFWNSAEERDCFVKTVTEEGKVEHYEMKVRAKSGELRDVLCSSALIRIDGKPHILAHIHDTTLQKRTEEKNKSYHDNLESTIRSREEDFHIAVGRHHHLEKEMQMLALVIHNTNEGVCVADLDGRIVFVNNAGIRMVGIEHKDTAQHSIYDFIPEPYKDTATYEVVPAILEKDSWEGDLQYRNLSTGMLIDVHIKAFLIKDPLTDKPLYLANLSSDITERKRAERNVQAS